MKRTTQQNKALHLYIRRLAKAMADSGHDMRTVIQVPIVPTPENVKELMIKPVLNAMWPDKHSTTDLSTAEISQLYEQINLLTSERWGIGLHFPSEEELRRDAQEKFMAKGKPDLICRRPL